MATAVSGLVPPDAFTARELIEYLKTMPPGTPVVLSTDPEGNSFRFAQSHTIALYSDGDLLPIPPDHTRIAARHGVPEHQVLPSHTPTAVRAFVLYPGSA
ncbi:hypothetical protein [Streptomyces sp. TR02-1]|uniref:hypothetical protein n=1 Tax=Streptomyces sp. TR02-1 TaxID=3385977 RepID=UPI0039A258B1